MRERATLLFRLRRSIAGFRLKIAHSPFGRGHFRASRFLLVPPPQDLGDASIAADIMNGQIVLAGRMLMTHGRQPFTMDAPSRGFAAELSGFRWLCHFDASDRRALREYAGVLVRAYFQRRDRDPRDFAENPATIARRLINLITYSALLTEGADAGFYRQLLDQLARDAALLRRWAKRREIGVTRVDTAMALLFHALCLDAPRGAIQRAEAILAAALGACIQPDGLPRDRNAASAARFAGDIEALLAVYRARQRAAPALFGQVMNRLLLAIRHLRHPDGGLALFNGAGLVSRDSIGQVLAIQKGAPAIPSSLPESGFERLENDHAVLIVDAGGVAEPHFAQSAGAGALSFEFSTRMDRVIVNCGIPVTAEGEAARAWRSGPAHSTLLIEEEGAGLMASRPNLRGVREDVLVRTDKAIPAIRRRDESGEVLVLAHQAFEKAHGYRVERELTLRDFDGALLGRDRFVSADGTTRQARIAFHLHPRVKVIALSDGQAIVLRLPSEPAGRDLWVFRAEGLEPVLEDSLCYESEAGNPMTQQILLSLPLAGDTVINWQLEPYNPKFN
jgi:uncharacterized heparinase superfamily protein